MPYIPKNSIINKGVKARGGSWRQYNAAPEKRGYGAQWRQVRAWYINNHPLCQLCQEHGKITPAEIVHHRLPIAAGGDITAPDNLEALCAKCHALRHQELLKQGKS